MTSYLLWHLVRICVFREAWPCPARANIWFIPLSTGSDQSDSCALASFAWNPPDNQCATLIHNKCMPRLLLLSVVSTIKPHFYNQHFIHLSGISRYMLGYRSSPKLSCQSLSGIVLSEIREKNMEPRCWPKSASRKFCTAGFSKNLGVYIAQFEEFAKKSHQINGELCWDSLNAVVFCTYIMQSGF